MLLPYWEPVDVLDAPVAFGAPAPMVGPLAEAINADEVRL